MRGIDEHYLGLLGQAQHREAVRQCDPAAIRADMAAAGVTMPVVKGAYRIGTRRVLDQADVATWYAVQTAPRMEVRVGEEMRDLGHCCRVPLRSYLRQTRRKARDGKFIMEPTKVPLCTGYAFLGLTSGIPDWRKILGRDGVVGVVGHDGTPQAIVRIATLYALFAADEAGVFDEDEKPSWHPDVGAVVQIMEGPFAGFVGEVKRAKGDAVRVVLAALFGGAEVEVSKGKLEEVG